MFLDYVTLGIRIREERLSKNMTQKQLADGVFLSTTYIGQIERGERHIPLDNLILIAKELNVSIDYLLRDSLAEKSIVLSNSIANLISDRTDTEISLAIDTIRLIFGYLDKNK